MRSQRRSAGLVALSAFFAFGTAAAGLCCVSLLLPGSALEPMWRLNPQAHAAFVSMGLPSVALMFVVTGACARSAYGLWACARWVHRLAVGMLALNFVADATNALVRGERRTLIGPPIAGALIAYLLSEGVRRQFSAAPAAGEEASVMKLKGR